MTVTVSLATYLFRLHPTKSTYMPPGGVGYTPPVQWSPQTGSRPYSTC